VALKNVTFNEPYFQGFSRQAHHAGGPDRGSHAQAGGALLLTEVPNRDELLMVFTGIERARFRRPLSPRPVAHVSTSGVALTAGPAWRAKPTFGDKVAAEAPW